MALSSPSASVLGRLTRYYGMEMEDPAMPFSSRAADGTQEESHFSPSTVFSPEVMAEVERRARQLYTDEQRGFLQRAPDLFVSLEDIQDEVPEMHSTPPAEGDEDEDRSNLHFYDSSENLEEQNTGFPDGAALASSGFTNNSQGSSSSPSFYQMATSCFPTFILLSPRVLIPSGTVGWAGEGMIFVNGGGVHRAQATMSASVAV
ncbi:unnamed protein product, partial [Phytomonas sp. Hart1]